ncbi:HEAT repeat protein OS=Ureibacillus acetophenoni OX=614649 GN=SAMN05877842_11553 PE=4 SV=1 [Ureibacillus acetophenoni]
MSILNKLSSQLGQRDEQPNINLAHDLVNEDNTSGIQEIIENLSNKNKAIRHDCIKVAYEVGHVKPELISNYAMVFVELLRSRDNRMVWGAMQALALIADLKSEELMEQLHEIQLAMKNGSVITVDKGVITLAKLAAANEENNKRIFPFLIEHLKNCRTKEVPQHAESTCIAVNDDNKAEFIQVLREREPYMTAPQKKRIMKILKVYED